MVAIIGNDAVLDAAPATSVQIAHACLRRGFTVAVPASWGDELVASEVVRRLAARERGPAVMCVCPFVRSRLLAPGPDLAPFLVSLVAPPVATARYLRAAYGEHGVHITYIGGCPSADDPSIDARLTPDAFLADLADHGIALAEQPLVFDSIVPPDRRRWCSLPGGAPTADVLWGDSDMRTLVEIDRDEVSTDLAQHIITHEHALFDLAPGLGCVCSGAIRSAPAHAARATVTAVEPPRAAKPIIDPAAMVSLDAPVAEHVTSPVLTAVASATAASESSLESQLDELLGAPIDRPWADSEPEIELVMDFTVEAAILNGAAPDLADRAPTAAASEPEVVAPESPATLAGLTEAASEHATTPPTVPEPEATPPAASTPGGSDEPPAPTTPERAHVRRRTPPPMPMRYPTSAIPRAMASDGKALPRAYVAKRRTPPAGVLPIGEAPGAEKAEPSREEQDESVPPPSPTPASVAEATMVTDVEVALQPTAGSEPSPAPETLTIVTDEPPGDTRTGEPQASAPETAAPGVSSSEPPAGAQDAEQPSRRDSNTSGGAAIATDTSAGPVIALLIALLAIGFFVLRAMK